MNNTDVDFQKSTAPLVLGDLEHSTRAAAKAFIAAGTAANTVRSYQSALTYLAAWLRLRYSRSLNDGPLPPEVAVQFIVDHLARPDGKGGWTHLLPPAVDEALRAAGAKSKSGPLAFSTVSHRLAVLAKWHKLQQWPNPGDDTTVRTLLRDARKAQARHGVSVRKKTAIRLEDIQAMVATCTDGVRGLRDRALLLLAWSGGGRRRSEVVNLRVEDLRSVGADWEYSLGATKTNTAGTRREKPLKGEAAQALTSWLAAAPSMGGALFRRVYKGGKVAATGLTGDQVARIVQRRAALAGLKGDWAAHSLRSGFVTEAGRRGVPLGDVMAMTEHRSVNSVMGYFQAGSLMNSPATELFTAGSSIQNRPDDAKAQRSDTDEFSLANEPDS